MRLFCDIQGLSFLTYNIIIVIDEDALIVDHEIFLRMGSMRQQER